MNILPLKFRVEVINRFHAVRNDDGTRTTTEIVKYRWLDKFYEVEVGFITDFSSYPRAAILWLTPAVMWLYFDNLEFLWYWAVPFFYPSQEKTEYAGIGHDKAWRDNDWSMSLFQGNLFWLCAALTGEKFRTRATIFQGVAGYIALTIAATFKKITRR